MRIALPRHGHRPKRASLILVYAALGALVVIGCSKEPSVADFMTSEEKLYSQGNEELLIRHFFADARDGVFVDLGAFEWKRFSTTYYLEKHLGWSGLAIDANSRLAAGYSKNRPRTRFYSYIVTDHEGTAEDFFLAGPVSSTIPDHAKRFHPGAKAEKVPTITLDALLAEAEVERIDFISIDIELGEPAALAGFDIEAFAPQLVCIEAGNAEVRRLILPYFEAHGYERIDEYLKYDPVNWYFAPRS